MAINTEIKPTSDQVLYQGLGPLDVKNTPVETIDKLPSTLVAYEGLTVPVMDDPEYHEMTDWWFKDGRWQRKTQKQKKKVDKNWQINKVVIKKAIPRYSEWENGVTYFSEDGTFTFKARYGGSFGIDTIDVDQLYYLQSESYNKYSGKDYINELISEPYVEQYEGCRLIDYKFEDNKLTDISEFRYCYIGWKGLVIQFMPKEGEIDNEIRKLASKRFYLSSHHFAIRDSRKGYINLYNADNCPQYIKFGISKDGVWRHFFIQIDGLFSAFEHNHTTDSEYDDDFQSPTFHGMNVLVRLRFKGYNAIHKRNGQVFLSRIENSDTMSPNVKIVNGKLLYDAKWDNSLKTNLFQNWYNEKEGLDLHNYKYGDTIKNIDWVYENINARRILEKMWSHSYIEKYRSKNARIYDEICEQYKTPGLYDTISKGNYGYSYGPFGEHQYLLVVNSLDGALNQKLPRKVNQASNLRIKVLDNFYVRGGTIRGIYMPKNLKESGSTAYTINNWSNVQELVLKYKRKSWYPYFMPHRSKWTDCKNNWFGRCQVNWPPEYKRGGTYRLYPVNRRKRLISVNYTQLSFPRNAAEKTWNI